MEGHKNVEDNDLEGRQFLLETYGCCVDLVIESLGILIDPGDATMLTVPEHSDGLWKATQWWEWNYPNFPCSQAIQVLLSNTNYSHHGGEGLEKVVTKARSIKRP